MIPLSLWNGIDTGTWVMIALAAVIAAYLWFLERKEKSGKAAALCEKYKVLTKELLEGLSDEELVNAVAANLLEKQNTASHKVPFNLALLSRGQAAVYSVWLCCHELKAGKSVKLAKMISSFYAEDALAGFDRIGATESAALWQAILEAPETSSEKVEALQMAIEKEAPLSLCVTYIRENTEEFIDS